MDKKTWSDGNTSTPLLVQKSTQNTRLISQMDMNLPSLCCGKSGVSLLERVNKQTKSKQMHPPFIRLDPTHTNLFFLKKRTSYQLERPSKRSVSTTRLQKVTTLEDSVGVPTMAAWKDAKVLRFDQSMHTDMPFFFGKFPDHTN